MSWISRLQPFALSGLLMTTATSCPPERFFWGEGGETEVAGPATCPVRDLPRVGDGPESLERAIASLADRDVPPAAFHREDDERLDGIRPCSTPQIGAFALYQDAVSAQVAALPVERLREILEGLYARAYVTDEAARETRLGTEPEHRRAKRELDLWIAAIDHRAYGDEEFLNRLWADGRIRLVMSLNGANLSPADRAGMQWMAAAADENELEGRLRAENARGYRELFAWLRAYDGAYPFTEQPLWLSMAERYEAMKARFGDERAAALGTRGFPRQEVERLLVENGLTERYRELRRLDFGQLLDRFHELSMALGPSLRPSMSRRLVTELTLVSVAFHERALDPQRLLEERIIGRMVEVGWTREDAELMIRFQVGTLRYTASRLDDYRARTAFLDAYRRLYREILSRPIEEVFGQRQVMRYSGWGGVIFNRSLSGVPVRLSELDRIRTEVQSERLADMAWPSGWAWFDLRDPYRAQWAMPSDFGLCGSFVGGPLMHAGSVPAEGRTLDEMVCDNIELIAILPGSVHPDHAAATSLGAFGIATLRSEGPGVGLSWTPGSLADTLAHEAGHNEYFRENFDHDSGRLNFQGINERRAHATGRAFGTAYFQDGWGRGEGTSAFFQLEIDRVAVEQANRRLGLPEGDLDPLAWRSDWDREPWTAFTFHPGVLANEHFRRIAVERAYGPIPADDLERFGTGWLVQRIEGTLPRAERREAIEALVRLRSQENTPDSETFFLVSHPLTRVVNALRTRAGKPPLTVLAMDRAGWFELQDEIARDEAETRLLADLAENRRLHVSR